MLVTQPDAALDAPQVTTTMVPFSGQDDLLLQVDLNYGTRPTFTAGGIQVRACIEDDRYQQTRVLAGLRLEHASETVDWTQVVQLAENGFFLSLANGSSDTWGDFGGTSTAIYVKYSTIGGSFSLDDYNPQAFLENSGMTYANNRVSHLRLKKIRVYRANGQVSEHTLNHDVL